MLFVVLSLVIFIVSISYSFISNRYRHFARCGVVGPKPTFPFGNTKGSFLKRRNILYDVEDIYREFKDKAPICGFFTTLRPYLLATDPELIKQIVIKDFKTFRNNDFVVNNFKDPLLARSPFRLKDDAWKEKRGEITPAMTSTKLKTLYPLILDGTKSFVDYINREITKDESRAFDARDICSRYTCDTISSCIFGADAQSFTSDNPFYHVKGQQLIQGVVDSVKSFFPLKLLPSDVERFFLDITKEAIRFRIESKVERDDFLSQIIALQDKSGISDVDAAGHCVTLFLDGFETTSLAIHHALYELGKSKQAQSKLRNEINDNADDDGKLSYDKLLELPYLEMVFHETLRMHSPLPFTTRVNSEDFVVSGTKEHKIVIRKGSAVWIPIHAIHRDPDYYPNPESFNPERFGPENGGVKSFKDRFVLIPFGDGPRICLGMKFAYMQVKAGIAAIVKNFDISIDKDMPENPTIGPSEYLNVTDHKLMLNFRRI